MTQTMVDVERYAELHGKSTRTVKRYLADQALPGAVKVDGKWSIPADAEPLREGGGNGRVIVQEPLIQAQVATRPSRAVQEPPQALQTPNWAQELAALPGYEVPGELVVERTLAGRLDDEPALIPADHAAGYIGVPPATVRTLIHQGVLQGVQVGQAHAWYVTQGSIRKLAGL